MAIPTTYTGQNSGAAPIFSGGKTEAAISQGLQGMLQARKADVSLKRQEAKEFQDALAVDPIQVMDTQAMQMQAQKLEGLNSKWTEIMKERDGSLTMEDKALMQSDLRAITAWQGNLHAKQQAFLKDMQQYDPRYHDPEARQAAVEKVTNGGLEGYIQGEMLDPRALEYDDYVDRLQKVATRGNVFSGGKWNYSGFVPGERGVGYEIWRSGWDEADARRAHESFVLSDPQALKTIQRQWESGLTDTQKAAVLDRVDANKNNEIDPSETPNAIIEADFQRNKDMFLGDRRKPRSQQTGVTQTITGQPQSVEARVVSTGSGTGVTKGTGFSYKEEGLSSEFLGDNIGGINFSYTDDVLGKWGIQVPTNAIVEKPEGAKFEGQYILARPVVAASGRVEWVAYGGKRKEITSTDYNLNRGKDGYIKDPGVDGETKYYKIDKIDNVPIATTYSGTSGILDSYFPGFRALAREEDVDAVPKTEDGKTDLTGI